MIIQLLSAMKAATHRASATAIAKRWPYCPKLFKTPAMNSAATLSLRWTRRQANSIKTDATNSSAKASRYQAVKWLIG